MSDTNRALRALIDAVEHVRHAGGMGFDGKLFDEQIRSARAASGEGRGRGSRPLGDVLADVGGYIGAPPSPPTQSREAGDDHPRAVDEWIDDLLSRATPNERNLKHCVEHIAALVNDARLAEAMSVVRAIELRTTPPSPQTQGDEERAKRLAHSFLLRSERQIAEDILAALRQRDAEATEAERERIAVFLEERRPTRGQ